MILDRQTISYGKFPVIEKLKIKTPFRYKALVQNQGCFIHFIECDSHVLSPDGIAQLKESECLLLKCGNHFVDLVKNLGDGVVEVVFIHLFPHILKEVFANELPDALRKGDHFDHLNIVSHEKVLTKYIDSLELYFQTPTLANDDILFLKIKELVLLLIQTKNVESIYEIVSEINSGPHVELRKVVRKHLYSTLSTEELAKMCNMSLSTFNRNFKKEFNDSPVSYINHRRIEKAQELLQQSNKSIADIAYSTGFNDPLYFSRLFKRETKKSPTQYREELKG